MTEEKKAVHKGEPYYGMIAADLHFGAGPAQQWYENITNTLIHEIESAEKLDFLVLAGDTLDRRLSLNTDYAKYFIMTMNKIGELLQIKKCKLVILKGTDSHDNQQLETLSAMMDNMDKIDVEFVYTVKESTLLPGLDVLYLPEEYIVDMDEYYAPYFQKKYDMIFGHGMVDMALPFASAQKSEITPAKAPVFKLDSLLEVCRGPIYFGHVHRKLTFKNRFHYVNSMERWVHGEEDDKGFYKVIYYPESKTYEESYVVNPFTPKYVTMSVEVPLDKSVEEIIDELRKIIDVGFVGVDHLRVITYIPANYENSVLLINTINQAFGKFRRLKIEIINQSRLAKAKESAAKVVGLFERFGFMFDPSISTPEKVIKFTEIVYNRELSDDSKETLHRVYNQVRNKKSSEG